MKIDYPTSAGTLSANGTCLSDPFQERSASNSQFLVEFRTFCSLADEQEGSWTVESSCEAFPSAEECLLHFKLKVIPQRLREASGLMDEDDIETLLDSCDYRTSFIAEELLCMIDGCLDDTGPDAESMERIRIAYNGLSPMGSRVIRKVSGWGSGDSRHGATPSTVLFHCRSPIPEGREILSGSVSYA